MRISRLLGLLILIPILAVGVSLSGCSKGTDKGKEPKNEPGTGNVEKGKGTETASKGADTKAEPLTAKTDGVIKGVVKFDGEPPQEPLIDAMKTHNDAKICLMGDESEKVKQLWLVGKDKGVANVIVFLKPPAGKKFEVNDELKKSFAKPAVIDQPHCAFVPHIVAIYPAGGQQLLVKNSSDTSHNTKITGGDELKGNTPKNVTLKSKGEEPFNINYQKDALDVGCDIHNWMNGKIVPLNQPYFAVTDKDGHFEIANVPSGVELSVMIWHESFGTKDVNKNSKEVEKKSFKAGDNDETLKISAK